MGKEEIKEELMKDNVSLDNPEDFENVEEEAYKILMTWSKEDLVNDILQLTTKEGLSDFVEQNELD